MRQRGRCPTRRSGSTRPKVRPLRRALRLGAVPAVSEWSQASHCFDTVPNLQAEAQGRAATCADRFEWHECGPHRVLLGSRPGFYDGQLRLFRGSRRIGVHLTFYRVSLLLPFEAQVKRRTTFPGMLRRRSQTSWRLPAVCNLPPPLWESCEPSGEKVKASNHQRVGIGV